MASARAERFAIQVEKSRRVLKLLYAGAPVKEYPVSLGRNPVDDKRREGDFCTPEGRFTIRDLYPSKPWHRFLWLSYPTADSRRKFEQAKRDARISQNATIGGEVGIHGTPPGYDSLIDSGTNWTYGCVSLRNADLEEIYRAVRRGTVVEVRH